MDLVKFMIGGCMQEEVSGVRFAALEVEVKHIMGDVSDIKDVTKTMEKAITSIDLSIALMAESIKQNGRLCPRVEAIENKLSKVELKMAAYSGGLAIVGYVLFKMDKIVAFFA